MEWIRFLQPDPDYKVRPSEVVVSTGQIVKIEPRYYQVGPDGTRWLTQVSREDQQEFRDGTQRVFILYDSLGNKYNSDTASQEGRAVIERIWMEAR